MKKFYNGDRTCNYSIIFLFRTLSYMKLLLKLNPLDVVEDWEVKKQKKAYGAMLKQLKNRGEILTQRDIDERLQCVEKLIRKKNHRSNNSVDDIGFNDLVVKEVNK